MFMEIDGGLWYSSFMQTWMLQVIENFGYGGIVFLITLENIFTPISSGIVLTFAGFMSLHTSLSFQGILVASTLGSLIGAILLYEGSRSINLDRIRFFVSQTRLGRWSGISEGDIEKAMSWFHEKGQWTVGVGRLIPMVRSFISIPAGMAHMPRLRFYGYSIIGMLSYNLILVGLGVYLGQSWIQAADVIDRYGGILTLIFLFIPPIWAGFRTWLQKMENKTKVRS